MIAGMPERCTGTLAELLVALRPGAPCPWCGEPVEQDRSATREGGRSEGEDLVCKHCGCQVTPAETKSSCCRGSLYDIAA